MNNKKRWMIPCAAFAITANAVVFIVAHNWSALLWLLFGSLCFYVILRYEKHLDKCYEIIKDQSDYINEADEHINYLTNHDTWKQIRQAKTEARISSANCYRYLTRIGQLMSQIEQLKTLNRNLLHNQGKGVKNYAKHTNRRADKNRTASDFE